MRFFQQKLIPDPIGPVLSRARKAMKLTLEQAARRAGIPEEEALALEEDRVFNGRMARLHAFSYARALGVDPEEYLDSLPQGPDLVPKGSDYLSRMAEPQKASDFLSLDLLNRVLAPLGKAVVILFFVGVISMAWGMMRQLSRVRSIPWITSSSRPASFHDR